MTTSTLRDEFRDPEARRDYAEILLNSSLALQIKVLRLQRGWGQEELARRADMHQSQISAMEQTSHSSWSVRTLKKIAHALDLALVVRFESFGEVLGEIDRLGRESLERPSFADDPAFQHGRDRTPLEADTELTVRGDAISDPNAGELNQKRSLVVLGSLSARVSQEAMISAQTEIAGGPWSYYG